MKYGACQWSLPGTGLEVLELVKRLGMDGMEMEYSVQAAREAGEYARRAEEWNLELPTIGMNVFCQKSYIEKGTGQMFRDEISRALEMACRINSRILQIPAFVASRVRTQEEFSWLAENLAAACELALPFRLSNGEPILIATENVLSLEQNQELCRRIGQDNFRFYFDTQNMCQMEGKPTDDVLRGMKDRLCEVHVKDSSCKDGVWRWTALGRGDTDFDSTIRILKDLGYDGWIHLETDYHNGLEGHDFHGEGIQDSASAIRRDLDYVRGLFL